MKKHESLTYTIYTMAPFISRFTQYMVLVPTLCVGMHPGRFASIYQVVGLQIEN